MISANRSERLQLAAGVLTWGVVFAMSSWLIHVNSDRWAGLFWLNAVLGVTNIAAMMIACRPSTGTQRSNRVAHGVQLASALLIGWLLPMSFLPIYTIIWIAIAVALYSFRTSLVLLVGVMLAWYVIMRFSWQESYALMSVALYGTFHLFAVLSARSAAEAEASRDDVARLNRELVATQHLLSEAARQSERTRIARDLHDLLGHHLTALSINLQIAEHQSNDEAKAKISASRALARLLLGDVREAVSTLREESALDFKRAIALVAENTPMLDVRLEIEDGLEIDDVEVAESLLRCVQEAITNTLRHAGAERCWIRVWRQQSGLNLEVRDDGEVAGQLIEGNGLAGMRERLARLRGTLRLDTVDDALRLSVEIPMPV